MAERKPMEKWKSMIVMIELPTGELQKIELPSKSLMSLATKANYALGRDEGTPVHVADLVLQAEVEGIIPILPKGYLVEGGADDCYFDDNSQRFYDV